MYMQTVNWPKGVKSALAVTVNLAAEFFWLQLDPKAIDMPKTLSMGQYGLTRGLGRVLEALRERHIKATFFVPGQTAETYPEAMRQIVAEGHEMASQGYAYKNLALLSSDEQRADILQGLETLKRVCGVQPKGFRAPVGELTLETLRLAREAGLEYSSDLSDDDRPYVLDLGNGQTQVQIPAHWVMYDLPYFAFNYHPAFPLGQGRVAGYAGVLSNWKDELNGYHERGLCLTLQVDPQTIGSPGRIGLLEDFLDYAVALPQIWLPTCGELCQYFKGE